IRVGHELAGIGDLVGRITALEAGLAPVEQRRRQRAIAGISEAIADRADMMVDAENLLNDHHAALGGGFGVGPVGSQLMLIGGSKPEMLTQGVPLFEQCKFALAPMPKHASSLAARRRTPFVRNATARQ